MSGSAIYLVQAFEAGPSGRLKHLAPKEAPSAAVAIKRAEAAAEGGGAVAVRRVLDEGTGEYGEPEVLARFGDVPREFA